MSPDTSSKVADIAKRLAPAGCGIGAVLSFLAFLYCACIAPDRSAAAATAAALALALAVLASFDLESFEGLGIKAKLRSTLSEAEKRLAAIDKLAHTLAKFTFLNVARMRAHQAERRAVVAELTDALSATGITRDQLDKLAQPFTAAIAHNFWYGFTLYRSIYLAAAHTAAQRSYNTAIEPTDREAAQAEMQSFTDASPNIASPNESNFRELRTRMRLALAQTPVRRPEDLAVLSERADEIAVEFENCLRVGNLTDRAVSMIDEFYGDQETVRRRLLTQVGLSA